MSRLASRLLLFGLLLFVFSQGNAQDTLYRSRFNRLSNDIGYRYHPSAATHIQSMLKNTGNSLSKMLGRGNYYLPWIDSVLQAHQLPGDLKYLAMASSMLEYEHVDQLDGGRGLWHFNYSTAKRYDLQITSFIDERRNFRKSTLAFIRAMHEYHNIYQDWSLASAAFVTSAIKVNKAIRSNDNSMDYFVISKDLEGGAAQIVPKMLACMYLVHYAGEHGIQAQVFNVPAEGTGIVVDTWVSLKMVGERFGISLSVLRWLNPDYRKDVIPDTEEKHLLFVPLQYADSADKIRSLRYEPYANVSVLDDPETVPEPENPDEADTSSSADTSSEKIRVAHKVKAGETLYYIASKYKVSVNDIKEWNKLGDGSIKKDQVLYVYIPKPGETTTPAPKKKPAPQTVTTKTHKVKSGETLSGIAERYNCTVTEIKRWNNLKSNKIFAGQKLKIKK